LAVCERFLLWRQTRPFQVLNVTVLTSLTQGDLPRNWHRSGCEAHVRWLADDVLRAGFKAFVCSAFEVESLRTKSKDAFIVTPGVRLKPLASQEDQKRVVTAKQAFEMGADAVVVGRPIIEAAHPSSVVDDILQF